jgi:hypothetical protein
MQLVHWNDPFPNTPSLDADEPEKALQRLMAQKLTTYQRPNTPLSPGVLPTNGQFTISARPPSPPEKSVPLRNLLKEMENLDLDERQVLVHSKAIMNNLKALAKLQRDQTEAIQNATTPQITTQQITGKSWEDLNPTERMLLMQTKMVRDKPKDPSDMYRAPGQSRRESRGRKDSVGPQSPDGPVTELSNNVERSMSPDSRAAAQIIAAARKQQSLPYRKDKGKTRVVEVEVKEVFDDTSDTGLDSDHSMIPGSRHGIFNNMRAGKSGSLGMIAEKIVDNESDSDSDSSTDSDSDDDDDKLGLLIKREGRDGALAAQKTAERQKPIEDSFKQHSKTITEADAAFEEEMSRVRLRDRSNSMQSVQTVVRRRRSSSIDAQVRVRTEVRSATSRVSHKEDASEPEEEADDEFDFGYALSRTASRSE